MNEHVGDQIRETELARNPNGEELGYVRGRHYTEWVEVVTQFRRSGREEEAELLLLELVEATEREAEAKDWGVAPWYYEQLAIIYRSQHDLDREVAILERYAGQVHAAGRTGPKLLQRLGKAKRLRAAAIRDRRNKS